MTDPFADVPRGGTPVIRTACFPYPGTVTIETPNGAKTTGDVLLTLSLNLALKHVNLTDATKVEYGSAHGETIERGCRHLIMQHWNGLGNLDATPELDRALGELGGVFSGEVPGLWGDRRFIALIGVGSDRHGNLYVACGPDARTHGGTAVIRSLTPEGRLNWSVMSTEWLNVVDVDRASDANALYGSE